MSVPEAPRQKLTPTPLAFGERGGVFFQYSEAGSPMIAVKLVPQAVPGMQGSRSSRKRECDLSVKCRQEPVRC